MEHKGPDKMICIDGHEISISFTDSPNTAVINQVKQILLSSFIAHAPKSHVQPDGILAI